MTVPRFRANQLLSTAAVVVTVAFAVIGIGSPLLGLTVFLGTDHLTTVSPYFDAGLRSGPIQNTMVFDTWNAAFPSVQLFAASLREGAPAWWNPYVAGGTPLAAVPDDALFSPLTLPYYVVPGALAPGYVKLFEIAVSVLGCYLFLSRIRLSRPAAIIGGLVFASSGFMVMWTNWPQTRVAAVIPWLFWGIERLVTRRGLMDGVIVAATVAAMLLGGFPAVTAFTVMTAAIYYLVRVWVQHQSELDGNAWRRSLGTVLAGAGALVGGIAIAAVQLLPFAAFYQSWLIEGRGQTAAGHLTLSALATAFAPWTFGGVREDSTPYWYLGDNMVEASSFIGAAALVLVFCAVALPRVCRAIVPKGVWPFFVIAAGWWTALIYLGIPLRLLQYLPVFSGNFVGRARSVLGFLLAVLVALGLEAVLRMTSHQVDAEQAAGPIRLSRPWRSWPFLVWLGAVLAVTVVAWRALRTAVSADRTTDGGTLRTDLAMEQLLLGVGLMAVAAAVVALIVWAARRRWRWAGSMRVLGVIALMALVAGQALSYVIPYWPRVDRATYYPVTDVHEFLIANVGHDRYVGTDTALSVGIDSAKRMRALGGHAFVNGSFAELLRAAPGRPLDRPTLVVFTGSNVEQATSPVLDRVGARYFLSSPRDPVFGVVHATPSDGGGLVDLMPDQTVSAPVPAPGPLRAVGFSPNRWISHADSTTVIEATLTGADGRMVASGRRVGAGMNSETPFLIPVAGEDVPPGEQLSVSFTLRNHEEPIPVASAAGAVAVTSVGPAEDGLKLVHAGSSVVYERTTALPRIRWASSAVVEPDATARLGLLAGSSLGAQEVVLNQAAQPADGRPAAVTVLEDGENVISARVDATGAGYLVVADALQTGWAATVDGQPTDIVPADHGLVAVPVAAGQHIVELRYASPYHGAGWWISGFALLSAAALIVLDRWRMRPHGSRDAMAPSDDSRRWHGP